jgi:hypothetical protein
VKLEVGDRIAADLERHAVVGPVAGERSDLAGLEIGDAVEADRHDVDLLRVAAGVTNDRVERREVGRNAGDPNRLANQPRG